MKNLPPNGHVLDHVTHFKILECICIFGMVKDTNFVFGIYIDHNMY